MDTKRQAEYAAYYEARMKKYAGNDRYKRSYETEKALFELMRDASSEEEYKRVFFGEKLNIKNAIALVKDRESLRHEAFMEMQESVRALGPKALLDRADSWQNEQEIVTDSTNLLQENSKHIAVDGFVDYFYDDFMMLENIEVKRRAEVPGRWKSEREKQVAEMISEGRKQWQEHHIKQARQWDPAWSFNHSLVRETRHRRAIPMPDEVIEARIKDHKEYRGI